MGINEEFAQAAAQYQPTVTDIKRANLEASVATKREAAGQTPVIGGVTGDQFYDADTTSRGTTDLGAKGSFRLGDLDSSTANYLNAPEAPSTIKRKTGIEATPEQTSLYNASIIAKDNFALGTTPATKEEFQDLIDNPLTPENQELYNKAIQDVYSQGLGDKLDVRGQTGHVGTWGRQVGQVFNPQAPNPEESLQDRLLTTGNAEMFSYGKPTNKHQEKHNKYANSLLDDPALDDTSRIVNDSKVVVSSVLSYLAGAADSIHDFARGSLVELYGGEEEIDNDFEKAFFGEKDNKFLGHWKNRENTDSVVGASDKFLKRAEKAVDKEIAEGDYFSALMEVGKHTDVYLAESAGEMGLLAFKMPGLMLAVGNRVNNDIETYKKEHEGESPSNTRIGEMIAGNIAVLGAEQLLVFGPIRKIVEGFSKGTTTLKSAATGVATSAAGEALQEIADQAQQKYTTTDGVITTDEAIKAGISGAGVAAPLRATGEAVNLATQAAPGVRDKVVKAKEKFTAVDKDVEQDFQEDEVATVEETVTPIVGEVSKAKTVQESFDVVKKYKQKMDAGELSAEQLDDFKNAYGAYRQRKALQDVEEGKTLGSTSDEEVAAINAYFLMEDPDQAEVYRQRAQKTNPEMAEKFEQASKAREMYADLGKELGLTKTRKQVVTEGLDWDKPGFRTHFRKAIAAETEQERVDAQVRLQKFTTSQQEKADKLVQLRQDTEAVMHDRVADIAKKSGQDKATVVKAMMLAEGSLLAFDEEQNRAYYRDAIAVVKGLGLPTRNREEIKAGMSKMLKTDGVREAKYAAPRKGVSDGIFRASYFESLPDIAEEYGVTDEKLRDDRVGGSSVRRTTEAIEREIVSMRKALALVGKPTDVQDTTEVVAEGTTEGTPQDTVVEETEVTPEVEDALLTDVIDEGVNEYAEATRGDKVSIVKDIIKTRAGDTANYTAEEEQIIANASDDGVLTEANAELATEVAVEDTPPDLVVEEEIVTEDVEVPADRVSTGSKFIDESLNVNVTTATETELASTLRKLEKTKSKDADVVKLIDTKKKEVSEQIDKLSTERKATAKAKREEAEKKVAELTELRNAAQQKLQDTRDSVADITEATKGISEMYKERAAVRSRLEVVTNKVNEEAEKVTLVVNEMNGILQEEVPGLNDLDAADIDKTLTLVEKAIEALRGVNTNLTKAMETFVARVRELIGEVSKYKAVQKLLVNEEKALTAGIKDAEALVTYELDDNYWKERRAEAKKLRNEQFAELREANVALKEAKDELKGVSYTTDLIVNSKKGKKLTNKHSTADKAVPLDMNTVLTTTAPSTQLGSRELSREEVLELGFGTSKVKRQLKGLDITDTVLSKYAYLMLMLNEDNSVNKNVLASMIVSVDNYMGENLSALEQVTKKDIESFYGINDLEAVEDAGKYYAGGIPRAQVAKRIAGDITKALGISYKPAKDAEGNITDTQEELFEKISIGLANAAIQDAIDTGKLMVHDVAKDGDKLPTPTLKLASKYNENAETRQAHKDALIARLGKYEENLGLEKAERVIKTKPTVRDAKDVTIRRNNYSVPAPKAAKAIVKEEQTPWRPNEQVIGELMAFDEKALKTLLGYKEEDATRPLEEQLSTLGKNRQIQDDIDNMGILWNAMQDGTVTDEMYFDWFVSKNGRLMLDARGGFNPQGTKLHRYAAYKDGMKGTVAPKDREAIQMYKLGIAQALGYSIDKRAVEDSIAFADALLNTEGAFDTVLAELKKGNTEFEVADVEIEIEEPSHALQAVIEGKKYTADKPFDTVMTLEVDGLTNGFAHKMLQFLVTDASATSTEIDDSTIAWLEKVGVQFKDGETVGDVSARLDPSSPEAIVDAYLTLGEALVEGDGNLADKLEVRYESDINGPKIASENLSQKFDTGDIKEAKEIANSLLAVTEDLSEIDAEGNVILTKAVRTLMKYPFMTWGYQAGFKSISNTVASSLIDDVVQQIVEYDGRNTAIAKYVEGMGIGTIQEVQAKLPTELYNQIGAGSPKGSFEMQFRKHVAGVYGDAIREVMESEFSGIMEMNDAVTQSTKMMFELFDKTLQERTPDGVLSQDEMSKLVKEELWDIFPLIQGPLSEDIEGATDFIPSVTDTTALAQTNVYGPIQTYTGESGKDSYINPTRKTVGEPGVGIGVGLTHNEDAAGTVNNMLKHNLLQIFDAYVLGTGQSKAIVDANKDFAELNMSTDWSQIKAVEKGLARILDALEVRLGKDGIDAYLSDVHGKMVQDEVARASEFGKLSPKRLAKVKASVSTPIEQLDDIRAIRKANDTRRSVFASKEIDVQQFVHDEKTGYTNKKEKVIPRYADTKIGKANSEGLSKEEIAIIEATKEEIDRKGCAR